MVFKYPSIDRVKIFLNHWCCSVSMYLLFKGIVKVISNDSCTLRILQSNNKNIIFLAKNCSFLFVVFLWSEMKNLQQTRKKIGRIYFFWDRDNTKYSSYFNIQKKGSWNCDDGPFISNLFEGTEKRLELCTTLLGFRVEKGWH